MTAQELYNERIKATDWPTNDLCDPPTDPREAVHILIDHLLGPDWCVTVPESDDQVITVAVCQILAEYPPRQSEAEKPSGFMQKVKEFIKLVLS